MRFARAELKPLLDVVDHRLVALLYAAEAFALWTFKKDLLVTSLFREGDPGVHGKKRAADIAVDGELSSAEQNQLEQWINIEFPYAHPSILSKSGKPYQTCIIEKKGVNYGTRPATGNCIHLQVRPL